MDFLKTIFAKLFGALFSSSNPVTAVADAVDDTAKIVQKAQDAAQQHHLEQAGVTAQQNQDKQDQINALADDRVRDDNDALQLRVSTDHGITTDP